MFSLRILQCKYSVLVTASLLVIPIYSWNCFFKYWKKLQNDYQQAILFNQRHNCVVTYQANKGFSGWPPNVGRVKPRLDKPFEELYEPILYFISTAEKTLDVAVMLINVKCIFVELVKAKQRGVTVKIIFDFHHTESSKDYIKKAVKKYDIECQYFVTAGNNSDTIMHHKYLIKDYSETNGFVCTGSMNFSTTSVLINYESFVFMSNRDVVSAFKRNFDEIWESIHMDNQGLINKTILMDAHLES
ncbi:unnamed protein product [Ceutorhynchus assimilis]|uniref:Mitochondrial cardiolipin hydrolase n=1 Tax=Ceutorhynchus assimilis TaxID=467358 RepID=A0A9N9MZY7_9CUCU|nr:unnamed protein product [Ceutorhynchus assimilis]